MSDEEHEHGPWVTVELEFERTERWLDSFEVREHAPNAMERLAEEISTRLERLHKSNPTWRFKNFRIKENPFDD